jgi:calcineurin-like phosphoesterase family protein
MRTFFTADLHLGDDGYTRKGNGRDPRPFQDASEMDRALITYWNALVRDDDLVWVLGDVAKSGHLHKVSALSGLKRLVAGNRDPIAEIARTGLFAEVHAVKFLPGLVLSHVPLHPSQLGRGVRNVHGHLHRHPAPDRRYTCVSVDQTGFRPVQLDAIMAARSTGSELF